MTLRSLALVVATAVVSVGVSSLPAAGATDLEKAEKKVGKSAQSADGLPAKPKGACVCLTAGNPAIVGKAGFLRQYRSGSPTMRIAVDCLVYAYDGSGAVIASEACFNFEALPK